jgi:hypothetical protein
MDYEPAVKPYKVFFNGYSFPDGSLCPDDEDLICKRFSLSEFAQLCTIFSYDQVCQINSELNIRASRIRVQIKDKMSSDPLWISNVNRALSIIEQKIAISVKQLNHLRSTNIAIILEKIGGIDILKMKRLALIKCLLHIIYAKMNIQNLSSLEKSIIDISSNITGIDNEYMFDNLNFNPVTGTITSSSFYDVAKMCKDDVISEQQGYMMAKSWDMCLLLERIEPILRFNARLEGCHQDTGESHKEVVDMLTELK